MKINWFPGHMNSAFKVMQKEYANIDLILYVLDSRAPFSCLNPSFDKFANKRPVIYILSKSDLAEENETNFWQNYFSKKENSACIAINSTVSGSTNKIKSLMKSMLSKKTEWNKRKGLNIPFRVMVIGVPNCGKSTLINNFVGKAKTVTGDKPGVTRGKQWIMVDDNINLLDTPGVLWPNLENEKLAERLAYIGSIKSQVVNIEELALEFIKDMNAKDKTILQNRYQIAVDDKSALQIYEEICKKRGFIARGGDVDYERGANGIFDDFRKGKLGRITLDERQ